MVVLPAGHKLRLHHNFKKINPNDRSHSDLFGGGWWIHPTGCKLRLRTPTAKKQLHLTVKLFFGGGWWIRTTEGVASRFTVCPLWPLGKSPIGMKFYWSWWTDSNPRPADYKSAALPAELHQHMTSEIHGSTPSLFCQQKIWRATKFFSLKRLLSGKECTTR